MTTPQSAPTDSIHKKHLIAVRDYNPMSDTSFIYSTWLRGLHYGNRPLEDNNGPITCQSCIKAVDVFYDMGKNIFYECYHRVIEGMFQKKNVTIKIACLKDDPEVILGYAVTEQHPTHYILHWVHVKEAWRRIGLVKEMIQGEITHYTHLTKRGKSYARKNFKNAIFNPFLI